MWVPHGLSAFVSICGSTAEAFLHLSDTKLLRPPNPCRWISSISAIFFYSLLTHSCGYFNVAVLHLPRPQKQRICWIQLGLSDCQERGLTQTNSKRANIIDFSILFYVLFLFLSGSHDIAINTCVTLVGERNLQQLFSEIGWKWWSSASTNSQKPVRVWRIENVVDMWIIVSDEVKTTCDARFMGPHICDWAPNTESLQFGRRS